MGKTCTMRARREQTTAYPGRRLAGSIRPLVYLLGADRARFLLGSNNDINGPGNSPAATPPSSTPRAKWRATSRAHRLAVRSYSFEPDSRRPSSGWNGMSSRRMWRSRCRPLRLAPMQGPQAEAIQRVGFTSATEPLTVAQTEDEFIVTNPDWHGRFDLLSPSMLTLGANVWPLPRRNADAAFEKAPCWPPSRGWRGLYYGPSPT